MRITDCVEKAILANEMIAPLISAHHSESFRGEVELTIEELEAILAPTPSIPIPPPFRFHERDARRPERLPRW